MKTRLFLLFILIAGVFGFAALHAQHSEKKIKPQERQFIDGLPVFTDDDLSSLKNLPELNMPENIRGRDLPVTVDNSELPYFRPIFNQTSLECGQASGVAYTFTYEIDRLRDLPANVPDNQYPTHFVFNWSNNGSGSACPYFDSWDIIKHIGTPNVTDYGGDLNTGGTARWMTGYDLYYNAMHNRLWDFYSIKLDDVEGLNTLRNWIDNHLEGAQTGGVANIYASYTGVNKTLPPGTPEAGKYVLTELGSYANHALCIVGYHDSIRYDLNNDGQYTNHLDINNDGTVDLRDWEMGGVKLANSYSASSWGNEGFAYLLYSGLCRDLEQSGIWNGAVQVIKAKENAEPQLTYKVTLTHNIRNQIKVLAGVATTPNATEPEFVIGFPILNYQGGQKYMQGGTSPADKTLEFGLDVTPLLSYIESGTEATFFLMVNERDYSGSGEGSIDSFSVMDYTDGLVEIPCQQTNVPLVNNDMTVLPVTASVNFENPQITDESLPAATINEPYSYQMNAEGGAAPYQWKYQQTYAYEDGNSEFPMVNQQQLYPSGSSTGYAVKEIDFEFPFYGKQYDKIYMHTDGYLMFEDDDYPWTFLVDQFALFRNMRNISPFMSKTLQVSGGGGMWYEGSTGKATFRWKATEYSTSNILNFAVSLYPSGKIEFYYGEVQSATWNPWFAGLSDGRDNNYEVLDISNTYNIQPDLMYTFEPEYGFTELQVTEDGLFHGIPTVPYEAVEVTFLVKDANGMKQTKTLPFFTDGINSIVIRDVTAMAGGDDIIEYGESVLLTVEIQNISDDVVDATQMTILTDDGYITLTDSTETLGSFEPGEIVVLEDAFAFDVGLQIPDNYDLVFSSAIETAPETFNSHIYLKAWAPEIAIGSYSFDDGGNGFLEPGETAQVLVNVMNYGGGKALNVMAELENSDPYITITQGSYNVGNIAGSSSGLAVFEIAIDESTPIGYTATMSVFAEAEHGFSASSMLTAPVGFVMEDFESAGFDSYEWEFGGAASWYIDENNPYEGTYCARSGAIGDDESSDLFITLDVLADGEISFYYKVSSEANYDFLRFFIDGTEMGSWAGETDWSLFTAPVSAGEHTFKWSYDKDYSWENGQDCGWIDYIVFPPCTGNAMVVTAGPDMTICEDQTAMLEAVVVNAASVEWTTSGDGTFDDPTLVNPAYTPGTGDISYGSAELTLTAFDGSGDEITDHMMLYIEHLPIVSAGSDASVCEDVQEIEIEGLVLNTGDCQWFTSGV
ncbi:MAG: hypothetical protein ACLFPE_06425, partial [Bacteroidales bacterium]